MKFPALMLLLFTFSLTAFCQETVGELIWHSDTSRFTRIRGLPGTSTERLTQMPVATFDTAKTREFAYSLSVGWDRRTLLCCVTAVNDSVFVGIDWNLDAAIQASEVYRYSAGQFKSEDLVINFSIKVPNYEETFFALASFKKTSLELTSLDSTLKLNPLYLQSKHYLRSSFILDGETYHVVAMNVSPTIGLSADFQYLITEAKVEDSAFLKIMRWQQDNDTILINADKAIVARRKSETKIGFDVFRYKGAMGTFLGAKMPTITARSLAGAVLQLPTQQPGKLHLIEFWGTWCGPCVALYPRLDSLLASNTSLLAYTGVPAKDKQVKVSNYVKKKRRIQQQVFEPDANSALVRRFKIHAFPSFLLVDDNGVIVVRGEGTQGFNQVVAKVREMKSKSETPAK
ncbi:MAG: TlpA family protein disulfide reductase [Bacteroidetes bacterium]|nr:MAG: TlpA family protein disulfide reductase [Bacteroidota bacterium]